MPKKTNIPRKQRCPSRPQYIEGLTVRQTIAIQTLLSGAGTEQAAKAAGVVRTTISAWVNHDAAFSATLKRLKVEALESGASTLRNEAQRSIQFLASVRDDPNEPTPVRVKAATDLLKISGLNAGVEWSAPMTDDEFLVDSVLANRLLETIAEDRREHRETVKAWLMLNKDGQRALRLQGRIQERETKLGELSQEVRRLHRAADKLPRASNAQGRALDKALAAEDKHRDLTRLQQAEKAELSRLRAMQRDIEAGVLLDPGSSARDLRKLYKLINLAGREWTADKVARLGRHEGVAELLTTAFTEERNESNSAGSTLGYRPPSDEPAEPPSGDNR